ncbi:MAG: hypothetical protein LBE80_09830 [Deltaproteobacteria bacterium]|nr:hypothetical protein [Deltaproteobacteria bacterium]
MVSLVGPRVRALGADQEINQVDLSLALESRLNQAKLNFENQVQGLSDQRQISALALRAAAEAFLEAAALADKSNELFDPVDSLAIFEAEWAEAQSSWAAREGKALRFYFEALSRLTARLAVRAASQESFERLEDLFKAARAGQKRPRPLTVPAMEAEAKVFWSNRLCALATILGSLETTSDQKAQINDLIEDLINRSEVVARRTDIHYQAKMELLYLNNAQSLSRVLFLISMDKNSPIAPNAREMEEAWLDHLSQSDLKVSDRVTLTWVTNAQLAFPLAWWLATRPEKR